MMMNHSHRPPPPAGSGQRVEAARHLCQEARVVLTSLRGGPPHVARGELAQDLMELRDRIMSANDYNYYQHEHEQEEEEDDDDIDEEEEEEKNIKDKECVEQAENVTRTVESSTSPTTSNEKEPSVMPGSDENTATVAATADLLGTIPTAAAAAAASSPPNANKKTATAAGGHIHNINNKPGEESLWSEKMSRPFLQVVMDPRAAGPHTLVALRAIYRLLEQGSFFVPLDQCNNSSGKRNGSVTRSIRKKSNTTTTTNKQDLNNPTNLSLEGLTQSILACKFEQTDAGQDEAVEMAIADVLSLLVRIDTGMHHQSHSSSSSQHSSCLQQQQQQQQKMLPATLHEAFHTVFVTRNTFVHSPALCYHFEDVLTNMVEAVFSYKHRQNTQQQHHVATTFILEFLVNQLLHTPLVGGDGLDESAREAAAAHDATRVLCLRLTRTAITTGWTMAMPNNTNTTLAATTPVFLEADSALQQQESEDDIDENVASSDLQQDEETMNTQDIDNVEGELISIIQDDLCLSLLMTGQAIWAYHDHQSNISPGFVSLEVLSEICSTLSTLWNCVALRRVYLIAQFETIFTGFYTRACVLLRKRREATNSLSYNANLIFDSEIEIILESLLDILCLHDPAGASIAKNAAGSGGAALEEMFLAYDCHLRRSDVAIGLMVELCRCCDGTVNEEGEAVCLTPSSSDIFTSSSFMSSSREGSGMGTSGSDNDAAASGLPRQHINMDNIILAPGTPAPPGAPRQVQSAPPSTGLREEQRQMSSSPTMVKVEHPWRQVPAHLKELCASALMGGMKCLFRDDKPSAATMLERSKRKKSILARHISGGGFDGSAHSINSEGSSHGSSGGGGHLLRDIKTKKRLMRKAARIFNKKASRGIEFLLDSGLVPDPVTPKSVAQFLRNGIVVGLDKKEVGAYLGEAGKSPQAGKSPPCWERDWFHKECLETYCSLFRFEGQSLLDGLRMFLAAFRLPGEAQQIDRILQAFAESCGQVCEENVRLGLFSKDPKRASDAAYLLSFSIIMLNTDRHNTNIREDRKMSAEAFVKNNTDYGRDITEKGLEFPPEFLKGIYHSINEEEIRTEGEGADGAMTVERWKDVLRGSTEDESEEEQLLLNPSAHDAEDLTEIVLEHVWKPIMSAIGAFWNVTRSSSSTAVQYGDFRASSSKPPAAGESGHSRMLGVQGARLGMDMSIEMLNGVRQLGRIDIFRDIFTWVCDYTGLLIQYDSDAVERTCALTNSVEAQAAVVVAIRTALEAGEDLDQDGWKRVWSIIFELRDLKVIPRVFRESDSDLLTDAARRDWIMCLMKGDMDYLLNGGGKRKERSSAKRSGVFGVFGRALFGSDDDLDDQDEENFRSAPGAVRTAHGKENLVIWDELAPSDDEDYDMNSSVNKISSLEESFGTEAAHLSPGALFEAQLIRESLDMSRQIDLPVTGLERMDETRPYQLSPRARLRRRLRHSCNWVGLISDSRFLDDEGIKSLLGALIELLSANERPKEIMPPRPLDSFKRSMSDVSNSTPTFFPPSWNVPISPASEAFAEVLICEIATKNRDRLKALWTGLLQDYYLGRLAKIMINQATDGTDASKVKIPADPGLEKRVTGLLRLSLCSLQRGDIANEVLSIWKFLLPMNDTQHAASPLRVLDPHISEGLYRIVSNVDGLLNLDDSGWEGLLALLNWCAKRGCDRKPIIRAPRGGVSPGLAEDDPALKSYRSLHLLLNTSDLDSKIPCAVVDSLRLLVAGGDTRNYPQLAIASLDLLHLLHEKQTTSLIEKKGAENSEAFWNVFWRKIVEAMAEAAERPRYSNVRQHALSMLTDLFLEKQNSVVPVQHLCTALSEICIPLAGRCILGLQKDGCSGKSTSSQDELMIEFELCIGLIFKPLRHHLQPILAEPNTQVRLVAIWKSILVFLEDLLGTAAREKQQQQQQQEDDFEDTLLPESLRATMRDLATEHLQSAIIMLKSVGVIVGEASSSSGGGGGDDISSITWNSVSRMDISEATVKEWRMNTTTTNTSVGAAGPQEETATDGNTPPGC